MSDPLIPFNRPLFLEQGLANVRAAFDDWHVSGDGKYTRLCQAFFEDHFDKAKVLLTTSCTDALELSALLLNLGPGDEVIMPSFTFVSTANAFALRGARPVFVDIRPDTFNLDESLLEAAVTSRTKAVVVVHYAGIGCEMDAICSIAAKHGLAIVEDNAHGLFGFYRDKPLGTFGQLATLSFHETKNLSCGEGGALVINDPRFVERAEILREKGTDRSRFYRGEIDKYTWRDVGSSFLPSDILAALLWAQMDVYEKIQNRRGEVYTRYLDGLRDWASTHGIGLPLIPPHCRTSYHMFSLLLPTANAQQSLLGLLRKQNIHAVFHYQPLHLTPMGQRLAGPLPAQCPVAESISSRILRLPFYFDLSLADQDRVINTVRSFTP
jgi:dTDP-4-amino-4,6-dideoxygalactose transaminase